MAEYNYPTNPPVIISDDWADHIRRGSLGGEDIVVGYGTPVMSMADGTVTIVDNSTGGSGGRYIRITDDNGISVEYLHLSQIRVSRGQRVNRGQVVALSGASGFGSEWGYGAHLHIHGVRPNGVRFNIFDLIGSASAPAGVGQETPLEELLNLEDNMLYPFTYIADDGNMARGILGRSGAHVLGPNDQIFARVVSDINGVPLDKYIIRGNNLNAYNQLVRDDLARAASGGIGPR